MHSRSFLSETINRGPLLFVRRVRATMSYNTEMACDTRTKDLLLCAGNSYTQHVGLCHAYFYSAMENPVGISRDSYCERSFPATRLLGRD